MCSPADGTRKNAIESLQKQIDFHVGEANRLRYAQNARVPVSRLPSELLSDVFLYIVESGLQDDNTRFAAGTFSSLQVCRRWNEVAVGFPQLWGWWVAGAVKAWPLFSSRSKGSPISLTWLPQLHDSARDIVMDPAIPRRIRQLHFTGTSKQLEHFLGAFDSSLPSNAWSIRLRILSQGDPEPQERLTRFISSYFPKLSQLVLGNFPPHIFPIFTTSSLTSLKLFLPYGDDYYTLVQFSHILQQHPTLRELSLSHNAIPLPGPPGTSPTSFSLPQLSDLELYGTDMAILGFLGFIGMSSPLHSVAVRFSRPPFLAAPDLADTVKRVLAAYYDCPGLNHPRKVNHLTISHNPGKYRLTFNARSHHSLSPNLRANLKLQFDRITGPCVPVKEIFPLFPLNDVHGLALEGSVFYVDECRWIFGEVEHLSYLRLDDLDLWLALKALNSGDRGMFKTVTESILICSRVHRWIAPRNLPQVKITDPISPRGPLRL